MSRRIRPAQLTIAPYYDLFDAPRGAPLDRVAVEVDPDGTVLRVRLDPPGAPPGRRNRTRARKARQQILGLLAGRRRALALDYRLPDGLTDFARAVLTQVARIPWGDTLTYGEVAIVAGRPGAARAVGNVMAANQLPLIVPCHRVVAAGGRLGGFGGRPELKRALLAHEGSPVAYQRVTR